MSDAELVRAFEQGRAQTAAFNMPTTCAWPSTTFAPSRCCMHALVRFATALRAFASAQGNPDLYHETITVAYVLLIADRLDAARHLPWKQFAERNPDLLTWKPSILSRFYSEDVLWSDRARQVFVMPDRAAAELVLAGTTCVKSRRYQQPDLHFRTISEACSR